MKIAEFPFFETDWDKVPCVEHKGETGIAIWRTVQAGEVRVRMVEYSPGYRADHWCDKGHVVLVLKGELITELHDGRIVTLGVGRSYQVSDKSEAHRSSSSVGAMLFIVD